jgi:hypothetical protein
LYNTTRCPWRASKFAKSLDRFFPFQVNAQLKAAIEFQSIEIARLRAITGNGSLSILQDENNSNGDSQQNEETLRVREMLQSRDRDLMLMKEEKERLEREEQRNRRELRRTKLALARAEHELDKASSRIMGKSSQRCLALTPYPFLLTSLSR